MLSLNLNQRCMLLVVFPLLCQIVFIGALGYMLWKVQTQTQEEARSRELISKLMKAERGILEDMSMASDPSVDSDIADLFSQLTETLKMAQDDPVTREQSVRIQAAATELQDVYRTWRIRGVNAKERQKKMLRAINEFMENVTLLVSHEVDLRTRNPDDLSLQASPQRDKGETISQRWRQTHEMRIYIIAILAAAVIASILAAIVLGYLYAVGISKPLEHITANSRLLSRRAPLKPVLQGNNELCELDQLFHQLAFSLNEAINREAALIVNAGDLICSLDYTGVFTEANAAAQKVLAIEPRKLVGRSLADLTVPSESLLADEQVRAACSSETAKYFELKLLGANGIVADTRWASFWSEAASRLFCVVHDVTEEKRVAQMKQDFLNMISHDLRSPLTSMLGSMTLISHGAFGDISMELRTEVDSITRNINRLVSFINDILDYQKLGAGKMELELAEQDLATLISDSVTLVAALAQANQVDIRVPEGHWQICCDGQKMVQTIVNLLSNAIKFSPPKSTIDIAVDVNPDAIQLSVTDCGPGIPDQFKQKIFEAFEQVPANSKGKVGTGLGLAIAKMIMDAHGGKIGAMDRQPSPHDHAKTGTTFWLTVPTTEATGANTGLR